MMGTILPEWGKWYQHCLFQNTPEQGGGS